jgi:hypothetical protein
MKGSLKGPLFFCENCGSPVPRDAKKCPTCGRFFANVRCPSCNFTGPESLFSEGCPICGYSSSPSQHPYVPGNSGYIPSGTNRGSVTPLPWWVYGITILAFIAVVLTAVMTLAR